MNKNSSTTSLLCPVCGNILPLVKKSSRIKELFHRDKIYCYVCKNYTKHVEIKNIEELTAILDLQKEEKFGEKNKVYSLARKG